MSGFLAYGFWVADFGLSASGLRSSLAELEDVLGPRCFVLKVFCFEDVSGIAVTFRVQKF